jgi:hypothetical protein
MKCRSAYATKPAFVCLPLAAGLILEGALQTLWCDGAPQCGAHWPPQQPPTQFQPGGHWLDLVQSRTGSQKKFSAQKQFPSGVVQQKQQPVPPGQG